MGGVIREVAGFLGIGGVIVEFAGENSAVDPKRENGKIAKAR